MLNIYQMFHLQTEIIIIVLYHTRCPLLTTLHVRWSFFEDVWYNQIENQPYPYILIQYAMRLACTLLRWIDKSIQLASSKLVVATVMGPKLIPVIDLVCAS